MLRGYACPNTTDNIVFNKKYEVIFRNRTRLPARAPARSRKKFYFTRKVILINK